VIIIAALVITTFNTLFAKKKGLNPSVVFRLSAVVFFSFAVFILYYHKLPAFLLPYMYMLGSCVLTALFWAAGKLFRQDPKEMFCLAVLSFVIYSVFSKLGCFLTGCCYGREYSGAFHVTYAPQTLCPLPNTPLFPMSLLTSFLFLVLAVCSAVILSKKSSYFLGTAIAFTDWTLYNMGIHFSHERINHLFLNGIDLTLVFGILSLSGALVFWSIHTIKELKQNEKNSWLVNILILLTLLTLSLILCGSSGENTSCPECDVCGGVFGQHTTCLGCGAECTGEETTEHRDNCLFVLNPSCSTCNILWRIHGNCSVCGGAFEQHTTCPGCGVECLGEQTNHTQDCLYVNNPACSACGTPFRNHGNCSVCGGTFEQHTTCPGCIAKCIGIQTNHAQDCLYTNNPLCSVCGTPFRNHGSCSVCGGAFEQHTTCPDCGVECLGDRTEHLPHADSSRPPLSVSPGNSVPADYEPENVYEGPTDIIVVDSDKTQPSTGGVNPLIPLVSAVSVAALVTLAVILFRKKASDR